MQGSRIFLIVIQFTQRIRGEFNGYSYYSCTYGINSIPKYPNFLQFTQGRRKPLNSCQTPNQVQTLNFHEPCEHMNSLGNDLCGLKDQDMKEETV